MVACPVGFRLADGNPAHQTEDIGAALDEALLQCARWGIIRPRTAAIGFSSGGHLALLNAHGHCHCTGPQAVVSVSGITDLMAADLRDTLAYHGFLWGLEQFIGAPFNSLQTAYAQASATAWAGTVPTLLVHGTADDVVPYTQAITMQAWLGTQGAPVDTLTVEAGGHDLFFGSPEGPGELQSAIIWWLRAH